MCVVGGRVQCVYLLFVCMCSVTKQYMRAYAAGCTSIGLFMPYSRYMCAVFERVLMCDP